MGIMATVWPVAALFGAVLVLAGYFRYGTRDAKAPGDVPRQPAPHAVAVAKGTLHCGSGCAIGDITAESLLHVFPRLRGWLGRPWLFKEKMFAGWVLDFILAFGAGIFFQYFAIAPRRHLPTVQGIAAALKADSLSLAAWQVGMYAVLALLQFKLFQSVLGTHLSAGRPAVWLAMQGAMPGGFLTSYPVNAWLIHARIKEAM